MKILVVHGPNLNMLGLRDETHYGMLTYDNLCDVIRKEVTPFFQQIDFFQSNSEGALVDKIQQATLEQWDALIINPGGYSHTSIAIHDALEIFSGKKVEVHLSDVHHREDFRKNLITNKACDMMFSGKKENSYLEALAWLKKELV